MLSLFCFLFLFSFYVVSVFLFFVVALGFSGRPTLFLQHSGFMFYRAGELQVLFETRVLRASYMHLQRGACAFPALHSLQVSFVQRVIDLLVSRPDKMDQDAVLTALTNWNGPPLPLYIFPPHLVQNGWQVTHRLDSTIKTTLTFIPFQFFVRRVS
jgi:hypothetical protein